MDRLQALGVKFPYFIAPMVGISHVAFRELVRHYTPPSLEPLLFTEMISSRRLPTEHIGEVEYMRTSVGESNLIPQLLCNEEPFIASSMEKLRGIHPWGVDINMGCPATQTLKHNWGVQLMHDKGKAAEVVRFAKKYSDRPISVKLRAALGRQFDENYLLEFTQSLEEAGADWLTIHCRTQEQGHHGYARWEVVEKVAACRGIPVVANGDVHTWEEALFVKNTHKVDGVMIARAATARPWILWQIAHQMGLKDKPVNAMTERPPLTRDEEGSEYFAAVLRLSCLIYDYFGDTPESLRKMQFYLTQGSRWLVFGHGFLMAVRRTKSLAELQDFVNDYRDSNSQQMMAHART